ncbi:MAG: DUF2953 domain-containing protein [Dethiobacteria bacterium]
MFTAITSLLKSFYFWFPFLFVFLLFFLPFKIRISFDNLRQDKSISLQLIVFLWGKATLFKLQRNFPAGLKTTYFAELAGTLTAEKSGWQKDSKKSLQKISLLVFDFMQAVVWRKFALKVRLGTGDAAWTALLTGFLRYLSGRGSPHILRLLTFEKDSRPFFLVYPAFQDQEFVFLLTTEFTAGGLKIIYYTVRIFWEISVCYQNIILRRRFKNGRASHPGFDDYSYGKSQGNG